MRTAARSANAAALTRLRHSSAPRLRACAAAPYPHEQRWYTLSDIAGRLASERWPAERAPEGIRRRVRQPHQAVRTYVNQRRVAGIHYDAISGPSPRGSSKSRPRSVKSARIAATIALSPVRCAPCGVCRRCLKSTARIFRGQPPSTLFVRVRCRRGGTWAGLCDAHPPCARGLARPIVSSG